MKQRPIAIILQESIPAKKSTIELKQKAVVALILIAEIN